MRSKYTASILHPAPLMTMLKPIFKACTVRANSAFWERIGRIALTPSRLALDAAAADYILLDYLRLADLSSLRMVVLVSRKSQVILEASELDLSADGLTWVSYGVRTFHLLSPAC